MAKVWIVGMTARERLLIGGWSGQRSMGGRVEQRTLLSGAWSHEAAPWAGRSQLQSWPERFLEHLHSRKGWP